MKLQVLAPDPFAFPAHDSHRLNHCKCERSRRSRLRRGCERSARGRPGRCWVNPTVSKNRDTEQFMDNIELEYIQRLDTQEWYDFLSQYFRWKFMASHLHERMMDLGQEQL